MIQILWVESVGAITLWIIPPHYKSYSTQKSLSVSKTIGRECFGRMKRRKGYRLTSNSDKENWRRINSVLHLKESMPLRVITPLWAIY